MEFTNEIFFNKPLTADSTVIITYSGKLYREHSKDVSIVFGYGSDWNETDNAQMTETENGFEVTLTIKNYDTFNFCFTNSFNIWDNNSGFNYISPIAPKQEELKEDNQEIKKENEITNEEINQNNDDDNNNTPINDSLGGSEEGSSSSPSIESDEKTEEDTNSEEETNQAQDEADSSSKFDNSEQDANVEAAFAALLDSILNNNDSKNESINVSELSGYGLQSVAEINEEDVINCDDIFAELFEELKSDQKEENTVINAEQQNQIDNKIEVENYENSDAKELDNLMDNLLLSITDQAQTADYATPIEKIESNDLENSGLPATIKNEDWVDKIINFSSGLTRKVSKAFKKIGQIVKLKVKELGFNNDKQ